jgi:hypothetical protein
MHATHPDTVRPAAPLSRFMPAAATIDDLAAATAMSIVILRQAGEGLGTTIEDFRAAPETCHLSGEQIEQNLGRASRIADRSVIRQDAVDYVLPDEAGGVRGIREATREDELSEATDAQLLDIAASSCGQLVTDDAIVGALLQQGLRPSAISRIWPALMARLAAEVSGLEKPSIARLAMRRRELVEA